MKTKIFFFIIFTYLFLDKLKLINYNENVVIKDIGQEIIII